MMIIGSGCAVPLVCDVSGSVAKDAAGAVLSVLASSLASTASWLIGHLIDLVDGATKINLGLGWFAEREHAMLGIAWVVVLPVLLAATIGPVLRQDARRLARVWLVGLPVSLLAGLLGVQLVQVAMGASDQLCRIIIGDSAWRFGSSVIGLVNSGIISGAPSLVTAVVSLLLIGGAVMVWLELVLRAASVYIAVFFMPLALIGFIWPATASMAKRTVELLAALILSKFVFVAALTLGSAAIAHASTPDAALGAGAILLLAAFAPFVLLRLAPIVEFAAMAHLEGVARRPLRAPVEAAGAVSTLHTGASVLRSLAGSTWGPSAEQTIGAVKIPERPPAFPFPSGGASGEAEADRPGPTDEGPGVGAAAVTGTAVRGTYVPERPADFPFPSDSAAPEE